MMWVSKRLPRFLVRERVYSFRTQSVQGPWYETSPLYFDLRCVVSCRTQVFLEFRTLPFSRLVEPSSTTVSPHMFSNTLVRLLSFCKTDLSTHFFRKVSDMVTSVFLKCFTLQCSPPDTMMRLLYRPHFHTSISSYSLGTPYGSRGHAVRLPDVPYDSHLFHLSDRTPDYVTRV